MRCALVRPALQVIAVAEQSAQPAALKLLAELSTVWLWYTWTCVNGPLQDAAARSQGYLQGFLRSWEPWAAAAQQLELYKQQQGFSRSVSAAELQEIFLLPALTCARGRPPAALSAPNQPHIPVQACQRHGECRRLKGGGACAAHSASGRTGVTRCGIWLADPQ